MAKQESALFADSSTLSKPTRKDDSSHHDPLRPELRSLKRGVSPPPPVLKRHKLGSTATVPERSQFQSTRCSQAKSTAAAIEAGESTIQDPVSFYSAHLLSSIRPPDLQSPRISHADWLLLYTRNAGSKNGCHFVVHQHDHPVAGTHYDLRLQCNETSSISFAIMYGLPGDPNSRRLNRNATETRVHCLWNHLIETASNSTGSMLIWDTGVYEVLPYFGDKKDGGDTATSEANDSDADLQDREAIQLTEQQKLHRSFQQRKVKLRMRGIRLPKGYTISLRLTKVNYRSEQPQKPHRRRRRKEPDARQLHNSDTGSEKASSESAQPQNRRTPSSLSRLASPPSSPHEKMKREDKTTRAEEAVAIASEEESEVIRANNAYPGATNDIGSVHQRTWYLSLDRVACGFIKQTKKSVSGFIEVTWHRQNEESLIANGLLGYPVGFDRFVVGGRETERSVVTGRLASEILADEGVVDFVPRGLWRAITQ